jgi:hypothetical protein
MQLEGDEKIMVFVLLIAISAGVLTTWRTKVRRG